MSITKKTVIGTADLVYNPEGILEIAYFTPSIKVTKEDLKSQLGDCKDKSIDEIKECAQLLLGSFFNKVSAIELRDVETTKLETEVVKDIIRLDKNRAIQIQFSYEQ